MNIVVCLKQVPGTTQVKINPQTNTLIRQDIKNIVNPFDTYALEEGVRLKERYGGKVTAISMGPPQAEGMLRESIAAGADQTILLSDRAFAGADTLATAYTLAQAIKKIEDYDLVICGKQTIDGDTGQVGPELAEELELPFIAYVNKIEETTTGQMRIQRMIEEGHELIETPLPAVISVVKEINVPRLPSLRGIIKAKDAIIPVWTAHNLDVDPSMVGLDGSATRVVKIFFPERVRHGEKLQGDLEDQVASLIEKLRKSRVI
ncbi:MAG: electron transfer flavoprotein subunit beta [Dehalococcoidales bacterium]|jgi:electron transfer flavoprotein beta subunit|nr:electron transfer flavoprotein subunit beta [Dehalococcoidales bacterium]MDP6221380.1 electron transfer flavoprotein subunit beta/FixA family protein [Dehalococcoidales bacterium]MDP7109634.1 electron transfer flavoprotein subunit beta/FixA family protein [Dehalococcoidales bacterium]MDP7310045.1 electron transfer flavoprotein subunit beta/FixA family protein [Dehalococcoidales bacterium]MDP7409567.1 electron transfer flavoprotein subunit beta/FixA family protein [Dehalococcoidales bacterium